MKKAMFLGVMVLVVVFLSGCATKTVRVPKFQKPLSQEEAVARRTQKALRLVNWVATLSGLAETEANDFFSPDIWVLLKP